MARLPCRGSGEASRWSPLRHLPTHDGNRANLQPRAANSALKKQILVIDDDPAIRLTLEIILTGAGYEVICAANGEEGVRLFRAVRPDLVITDVIMPVREGIETILGIRQEQPDARIIAMSGGGRIASRDLLTKARNLGADRIMAKPFDMDELTAVVQQTLSE